MMMMMLMLMMMVMLVFRCGFAGACRTQWVEMKDHEVIRGNGVHDARSLHACKTKCLAVPTCYGVTYSPGLIFLTGFVICSLAGPGSGKIQRVREGHGTPYSFHKLVKCPTPGGKICTGCLSSSSSIDLTNV